MFSLPYAPDDGDEYSPPPGLSGNDPTFTEMDIAWRVNEREGQLIGKHTHLKKLSFCDIYTIPRESFEACMRGVANNRSIEDLAIVWYNEMWGSISDILAPFIENNTNLRNLNFDYCESLGATVDFQSLSSVLGRCTSSSLESIILSRTRMSVPSAISLIPSFATLPRLTRLDLSHNEMIGFPPVCELLADLLRDENSALEHLCIVKCFINDEGAELLAEALEDNTKLKRLYLVGYEMLERGEPPNDISSWGWQSFSTMLCNDSSINETYLSNHTLERVYPADDPPEGDENDEFSPKPPGDLLELLALNSDPNKQTVAMKKILYCHSEFDMEAFFEWEFKFLPYAVNWFESARSRIAVNDGQADKHFWARKLDVIFQFARGLPEEMSDSYRNQRTGSPKAKKSRVKSNN